MGIIKEFRDFAVRGNVIDMAVGIIIGAAFTSIVTSLVQHILMPPIGMVTGRIDFASKKIVLQDAAIDTAGKVTAPEVAISYGLFINAIIVFVITAIAVFLLVKSINQAKKLAEREKAAAPPAEQPAEVRLLTEIRDLLAKRA